MRRAQRAVLNPDKSADLFLHGSNDDSIDHESQLTFSVNCVTLEISGPKVADLSFCDLPGTFPFEYSTPSAELQRSSFRVHVSIIFLKDSLPV